MLALRVWKGPLNSFDTDQLGGMYLRASGRKSKSNRAQKEMSWIMGGCGAVSTYSDCSLCTEW